MNTISYIVTICGAVTGISSVVALIIKLERRLSKPLADVSAEIKATREQLEMSLKRQHKSIVEMLKCRLDKDVREYIERGWIDLFTLSLLESLFEQYTENGGNGEMRNLMEKVRRLPNKSE